MERLLHMTRTSLPMKYLGSSLHKGINRKNYCKDILQSFDKKLTIWKQRNLSFGGRLILIKYVLNTIPLHTLAVDTLPKAVSKCLEKKMSHFLWGSNATKNKFHWIRWKDICLPYDEGGLNIRSLIDIEKAYSLKLWWKWRCNKSFWATFCNAKYPRGTNMIPKQADSNIWKRVCRIHELGQALSTHNQDGELLWLPESDGRFTLSSAFHSVRRTSSSIFSFKHAWNKYQHNQVQIFQWKALNRILPFPDNMSKFNIAVFPTRCPFCKQDSDLMDHVLVNCSFSLEIWKYFLGVFEIPIPIIPISLRQMLIAWWLEAGNRSLIDVFKYNMAGIISWHIWKVYCRIIWGGEDVVLNWQITIRQIKSFSQNWAEVKLHRAKFGKPTSILYEEGFLASSFRTKKSRIRAIRWELPEMDYKLNIDASYRSDGASGGAVLRSRSGELEVAFHFPISATSALDAEMQALHLSVRWAVKKGFQAVEVETDSLVAVDEILGGKMEGRWSKMVEDLRRWKVSSNLYFRHIPREINWTAHFLSKIKSVDLVIFNNARQLPLNSY
ncbi:unnamed protein product [Cuscuta epithymum]|uniref:RNase H type-1 domain-containing protein n=1 Tax=Cuscuta epithymum TaxID=186058 RepID=A0AAV0FUU7_9ASTE|nr:unnamed protein product [Cuscuta epithymum]